MRPGDAADFIVVEDLVDFTVLQTYIDGYLIVKGGINFEKVYVPEMINQFNCLPVAAADFEVAAAEEALQPVQVIDALDGQLITTAGTASLPVSKGMICTDTRQDVLKIAVINRYAPAPPAIGFIRNFGLKAGAIASTVAHDSHNIVVVGVDDEAIAEVVNALIAVQGGIAVTGGGGTEVMPLPIAGLITDMQAEAAAAAYVRLDAQAKALGSTLSAPFMTLSFMALPVIPSLKMTDKGLFNVDSFNFTTVTESKQL
ncbi:Adenine deaminase [compost metagenome]